MDIDECPLGFVNDIRIKYNNIFIPCNIGVLKTNSTAIRGFIDDGLVAPGKDGEVIRHSLLRLGSNAR